MKSSLWLCRLATHQGFHFEFAQLSAHRPEIILSLKIHPEFSLGGESSGELHRHFNCMMTLLHSAVHGFTDLGRVAHDVGAERLDALHLGGRGVGRAGDHGAGVTHAPP